MDIQIRSDNITSFDGDVIIVPCDTDLTYKKTGLVHNIMDVGGSSLLKELTAIGYCELGNAVIVKGYDLKANNVIFMPLFDHNNEEIRTNYLAFHQSLRSAFTLAEIYKAKSIAIGAVKIPRGKRGFMNFILKAFNKFLDDSNEPQVLSNDEIEDIVVSVSKDFEKSSISMVCIYKYSK